MSIGQNEDLKTLATSLATSLATGKADKKKVLQILEELGYASPGAKAAQARKTTPGPHIGIYSPQIIDNEIYYQRNTAFKAKWERFADIDIIPPKGVRKRIVLLGESVARGFLLDPDYTPAALLEILLNSTGNGEEFEVIDLAETNLSMEGIKLRYTECLALKPDLVIFFAGNNWRTDIEVNMMNSMANLENLVKGGINGFKTVIEEVLISLTRSFLSYLHDAAIRDNVELIFAIPEFNLQDYRSSPGEQIVTKLAGGGMQQWTDAVKNARAADSDLDKRKAYAGKMITVDPTHPLGYEILADCNLAEGDNEGARACLEAAKDCSLFFRSNSKPRIYSIIRDTIRTQATEYNIRVLDLADVFFNHLDGRLPDRTLFFDYCHLSAEGIQVAMDAVATAVLAAFSGGHVLPGMKAAAIAPDPPVNAKAHFLAAIHNSHWGQSYDILYYHCCRALECSAEIAQSMVRYCDMVNRKCSNVLCRSFEGLLSTFRHTRHINAFRHPNNMKSMELTLIDAMQNALKQHGIDVSASVHELRLKEHVNTDTALNLLDSYYHITSYDKFPGTKTAFFQARQPVSDFFFPGKADTSVKFTLTLRAAVIGTGKVIIRVNDLLVAAIEVGRKWSDHSICLNAGGLIDGMNKLSIEWPIPENGGIARDEFAVPLALSGIYSLLDAVYYVFAEIIHFKATFSNIE